jgi:hypothetical protein
MVKTHYRFVAIAALAVVLWIALPAPAVQAGDIGFWPFNEHTSGQMTGAPGEIIDASGNGHDGAGAPAGRAPYWDHGRSDGLNDGAARFVAAADHRVEIPYSANFGLMLGDLQSYRIEIDVLATAKAWDNMIVLSNYTLDDRPSTPVEAGYSMMLRSNQWEAFGRVQLVLKPYSRLAVFPAWTPESNGVLTLNEWHHVAVEIHPNADLAQTYVSFEVDGSPAGTVYNNVPGWVQEDFVSRKELAIGNKNAQYGAVGNGFEGSIDNVRFTNITLPGWLPGDADRNGTVNGADLNVVLSNYNGTFTGDTWSLGDFDGNGTVNGTDLNVVLSNYNQTSGLAAAVPEPSALLLAAAGLVGLLAYGWRKRFGIC